MKKRLQDKFLFSIIQTMKIRFFFFLFFAILLSTTVVGESLPLDDTTIKTDDGSCGIHYLTQKNITGWRLDVMDTNCTDGWVTGYANVTVRDAFGQPVEQIYGFFKEGYWTGETRIDTPIIDRFSTKQGVQSLSFDLGNDSRFNMRFIGQMKSSQAQNGTYGAFEACSPVRILAITDTISVFEDESVQQDLLNTVISKAHEICPKAHLIYFFGSEKDRPNRDEVVFFADLDLNEKQIRVRRLPSSPRLSKEQVVKTKSNAPLPTVIRQERGTPLMRVTPIRPLSLTDKSPKPETPPTSAAVVTPTLPGITEKSQVASIDSPAVYLTPLQEEEPTNSTSSNQLPLSTPDTKEPRPESTQTPPDTPPAVLDQVPHLLAASRLLKQPVSGQAAVHVHRVDLSGMAWIDEPVPLRASGRLLPVGWNIVEGAFTATANTAEKEKSEGLIQIKNTHPCPDMGCFQINGENP